MTMRDDLLAQAAQIGVEMRAEESRAESETSRLKARKGDATAAVKEDARKGKGYGTPRYLGLGSVAKLYHQAGFNDPDHPDAVAFSLSLAKAFSESYTAKTIASDKGGVLGVHGRIIRTGNETARILGKMQGRLEYWWSQEDSASDNESPEDAKRQRLMAERHTVLADSPKEGKEPKYLGRPARTIGDVTIPGSKGTTRDALLWLACTLYVQHQDAALTDRVLDAILDNGGRRDKPAETARDVAMRANTAIGLLLSEHGGEGTPDAVNLKALSALLDRIAAQGFKVPTIAASPDPLPAETVKPAVVAPPPLPEAAGAETLAETLASLPEAETAEPPPSLDNDPAALAAEALLAKSAGAPPPLPATPAETPKPADKRRSSNPPGNGGRAGRRAGRGGIL